MPQASGAGEGGIPVQIVIILLINTAIVAVAWGSIVTQLKAVIKRMDSWEKDGMPQILALKERVDGLSRHVREQFEEIKEKQAEQGKRIHRHRNWFTVLAHKCGVELSVEDDLQ